MSMLNERGEHSENQGLESHEIEQFSIIKFEKHKSGGLDEEAKRCIICLNDFED